MCFFLFSVYRMGAMLKYPLGEVEGEVEGEGEGGCCCLHP